MDFIKKKENRVLWGRPKTSLAIAIFLIIAVVSIMAFSFGNAAPVANRTDLWIDAAQYGTMTREIRATGILVPRETRWVVAGVNATVQQVLALPGTEVKAATPILELANPELQAILKKNEAILAGAEAELVATRTTLAAQLLDHQSTLRQAQSDWELAKIKAHANQRAYEGGAIAGIEAQQSQFLEKQAHERVRVENERVLGFHQHMDAQIKVAQARRDEAASAVDVARSQVAALQVRAGIDGIMQQIEVEEGQQVEIGYKLGRVVQPDTLMARLQVSEVLAKDLILSLPVSVDTRNGIARGRIIRIDPAVRDNSVSIDVALDDGLPPGARPDLSVDGRIELGTLENVIHLARPSMAVPDGEGTLFVLPPGQTVAQRVKVRYGAASSDRIQIRDGVSPGDQVVLTQTPQWADFDQLRLR